MVAPVIPALTDSELEAILQTAAAAGARSASYVLLRLPLEIKDLFREWLAENEPLKAERIIQQVRVMSGGRDYDATFGRRQTGEGNDAELFARRLQLASRRLGLDRARSSLDTTLFRVPPAASDQLSLL